MDIYNFKKSLNFIFFVFWIF